MPDRYDFENRSRNLAAALSALASLFASVRELPAPDDLAGTLALLRDEAAIVHRDGMALVFPAG